jgi:hypothetical protein
MRLLMGTDLLVTLVLVISSGRTQQKTPLPTILFLHDVIIGAEPQGTPFPAVLPSVTLRGVT